MNVSPHVAGVLERWKQEANVLCERYSDERMAKLTLAHVSEIEQAIKEDADEPLTLVQAELVSGYTQDHLGKLIRSGKLENIGRKHSPLVRRGDLPRKALQECSTGPNVSVTRTQIARAVIHRQTLETS